MKLLRPDIPADLHVVSSARHAFLQDETLIGLHIQHTDVSGLSAKNVVIQESKLTRSTLTQLAIEKFQAGDCLFEHCDLTASSLADSSWHAVEMRDTRCSGIQLQTSLIKNVLFKNCKLDMANLRFSTLENVIFEECVVAEMDLYNATLKNVAFIQCDIKNVEFSEAKLQKVDLSAARIISIKGLRSLKGATISTEQLFYLAPSMAADIGIIVRD